MKIENMTLRDYFAAKAMAAIIGKIPLVKRVEYTNGKAVGVSGDEIKAVISGVSVSAYEYADAMLAAREQEKTNQCGETCERAKLCAVCSAPLEQETPDQDGWIEWNGGRRPVGQYELVSVKTRGGGCALREKAICFRWNHADHPEDIIAYRVVKGGAA